MAQVEWVLRGRLLLIPQLRDIAGQAAVSTNNGMATPLAGVPVKISAKEFGADITGWNGWDEGITDKDGFFELRNIKDRSKRRFRVRVQFKDAGLKIYPPNDSLAKKLLDCVTTLLPGGPILKLGAEVTEDVLEQLVEQTTRVLYDVDWLTVHEDEVGHDHEGPMVTFDNFTFRADGPDALGEFQSRRHAEIWWLVKAASKYLADLGFPFRGDRSIAFLHPFDNPAIGDALEASYSNPYIDTTFLLRNGQYDDFDVGTILHEMTHLWAYQHTEQEERLATYLLFKRTTHTGRLAPWVAWHEAFAETVSNQLHVELFGTAGTVYGGIQAQHRPYSRPYLKSGGLRTTADLECFEDGWQAVFGLLLCPDVCDLDMNAPGPYAADLSPGVKSPGVLCAAPVLKLADILRAVGDDAKDGGLPLDAMRIVPFFQRIAVKAFTPTIQAAYIAILDPAETRQPTALLPSGLQASPASLPGIGVGAVHPTI